MNHIYAIDKLRLLLRDIGRYNADEFRRQMVRIVNGATGTSISDDCHLPSTANPILAQRIAELERNLSTERTEKQALAAQVEVLRSALKISATHSKSCYKQGHVEWSEIVKIDKALESTSAACLAHVRAEAVDNAVQACLSANDDSAAVRLIPSGYYLSEKWLNQCANRIRQGVTN